MTASCQEGLSTKMAQLTRFADSKGAGISSVDLSCPTPREVEELDQPWHHLILLLSMAQPAIPAKAPGEDALLGV